MYLTKLRHNKSYQSNMSLYVFAPQLKSCHSIVQEKRFLELFAERGESTFYTMLVPFVTI